MQKIEVKSYKMKSWEAFSSWNYVLHFFLNFFTDFFYFWYGTPNRYWDYLCEISSSYFGWFGRYLAWGGTLSGLVLRWPWSFTLKMYYQSEFYPYNPSKKGGKCPKTQVWSTYLNSCPKWPLEVCFVYILILSTIETVKSAPKLAC